jgi:tetratricopeptide (TPR) repeat protein
MSHGWILRAALLECGRAPAEDFLQTLKAAGASEGFLNALRAAVAPGLSPAGNVAPTLRSARADLKVSATTAASEPASAKKPLNQVQVFALLVGQVPSHRVTMLVQERGIDFEPTDDYLIAEERSALSLNPNNFFAHVNLGLALANKGDLDGAISEYRAALRLNPNRSKTMPNSEDFEAFLLTLKEATGNVEDLYFRMNLRKFLDEAQYKGAIQLVFGTEGGQIKKFQRTATQELAGVTKGTFVLLWHKLAGEPAKEVLRFGTTSRADSSII